MKAKVIKTGEIKSFYPTTQSGYNGYVDEDGKWYYPDELIFSLSEPEEVTIEGWVARDEDGNLFMYRTKPERDEALQMWMGEFANFVLRNNLFPDLTWEDEPAECKVTITIKPKKK